MYERKLSLITDINPFVEGNVKRAVSKHSMSMSVTKTKTKAKPMTMSISHVSILVRFLCMQKNARRSKLANEFNAKFSFRMMQSHGVIIARPNNLAYLNVTPIERLITLITFLLACFFDVSGLHEFDHRIFNEPNRVNPFGMHVTLSNRRMGPVRGESNNLFDKNSSNALIRLTVTLMLAH